MGDVTVTSTTTVFYCGAKGIEGDHLQFPSGTRKCSQILLVPGEAKELNTKKRSRNCGRDRKEYGVSI